MELTDSQLEKIRKAAREVDYGSVTINITKESKKLDLSVNKRIRFEEDFTREDFIVYCEPGGKPINSLKKT